MVILPSLFTGGEYCDYSGRGTKTELHAILKIIKKRSACMGVGKGFLVLNMVN
jgi:hypothetical protein